MPTRRRPSARAAALPARRAVSRERGPAREARSFLPTGRSLLIGLALLAAGGGAYVAARDTSVFAVQTIEVRGATPRIRAAARTALAGEHGRSLLRVGQGEIAQALAGVTGVRTFTYDRAFPHTLEVTLRREQSVLVLRQGRDAYLVSSSGRVLRRLPHPRLSHLPRLWVPRSVQVSVGQDLPPAAAIGAVAVAPLVGAPIPGGVRSVSTADGLAVTLDSGFQVRLGDTGDLRLKYAIARRILGMTGAASGSGYLDVSVPERPVLSSNSQVEG